MRPIKYFLKDYDTQQEIDPTLFAFLEAIHLPKAIYVYRKKCKIFKKDYLLHFKDIEKDRVAGNNNRYRCENWDLEFNGVVMRLNATFFQSEKDSPLFLGPDFAWQDRSTAFKILVETDEHLFEIKQNCKGLPKKLKKKVCQLGDDEIAARFAEEGVVVTKTRQSTYDSNRNDYKRQSIDADDVEYMLLGVPLGRSVLELYKVRDGNAHRSVNPNVGKVHTFGSKSMLVELLSHIHDTEVIMRADVGEPANLIKKHARVLTFSEAKDAHEICSLRLDTTAMREIVQGDEFSFYRGDGEHRREVPSNLMLELIDRHGSKLYTLKRCAEGHWECPTPTLLSPAVIPRTASFAIRLEGFASYSVVEESTGEEIKFSKFITDQQLFICHTRSPDVLYAQSKFVQDAGIETVIEDVLRSLVVIPEIAGVRIEKGLNRTKDDYAPRSLFSHLINWGRGKDFDFTIIEDMGTESFDVGFFNEDKVYLIHAKTSARDGTHSTSSLHDVVAQALKNYGSFRPNAVEIDKHCQRWQGTVNGTTIPRVYMPDCSVGEALNIVHEAYMDQQSHRTVAIAVPHFEKAKLEEGLRDLKNGPNAKPAHYKERVQLLWLISGAIQRAQELGCAFKFLVAP